MTTFARPDTAEPGRNWPELAGETIGSGPPLVLVHGGLGSRSHWHRNIAPLAGAFTVHAIDLPGYGRSPDVDKAIAPEDYADWVHATIDARVGQGASFDLAAFSFGATVGAALSAKCGSRIGRLSLIGPAGFGDPSGRDIPMRKFPGWDAPEAQIREAVAHNLGQWMLHDPPAPDDEAVDIQIFNLKHARFDSRRLSRRASLIADLKAYGGPVQILWGRYDRPAYPSVDARAAEVRAALPHAKITILPECGHWAQYEKAETVNRLLLSHHAPNRLAENL